MAVEAGIAPGAASIRGARVTRLAPASPGRSRRERWRLSHSLATARARTQRPFARLPGTFRRRLSFYFSSSSATEPVRKFAVDCDVCVCLVRRACSNSTETCSSKDKKWTEPIEAPVKLTSRMGSSSGRERRSRHDKQHSVRRAPSFRLFVSRLYSQRFYFLALFTRSRPVRRNSLPVFFFPRPSLRPASDLRVRAPGPTRQSSAGRASSLSAALQSTRAAKTNGCRVRVCFVVESALNCRPPRSR